MISPILNGEFPPQAGFSHKNLDPEAEGERIRVRRGCVTFEKGGGEQVAVVQFARAQGGNPLRLCPSLLRVVAALLATPHFDNKKSMLGMQFPPRKCE